MCDSVDACAGDDSSGDQDADGFCALDASCAQEDCDDANSASFPGAPELCDGLDNACVGRPPADEVDLDNDGVSICAGDCDDLDPTDTCGQVAPTASKGCTGWPHKWFALADAGAGGPSAAAWTAGA